MKTAGRITTWVLFLIAMAPALCQRDSMADDGQRPGDCGHGIITAIGPDGLVVVAVGKGSPGEAAGVRAGDIILRVRNRASSNLIQLSHIVNPPGGRLSCGEALDMEVKTEGPPRAVTVQVAPYQNPLVRTPFVLSNQQGTSPTGQFTAVTPGEWTALQKEALHQAKEGGPVQVGAAFNPGLSLTTGAPLFAPGDGTFKLCLYTPRLALLDHLIRIRLASQPAPGEELIQAYSKANAFCVTAHPPYLVASVALVCEGREIHPDAVTEGNGLRFWFPLDAIRSGEDFTIVLEGTNGYTMKVKLNSKKLEKLKIR